MDGGVGLAGGVGPDEESGRRGELGWEKKSSRPGESGQDDYLILPGESGWAEAGEFPPVEGRLPQTLPPKMAQALSTENRRWMDCSAIRQTRRNVRVGKRTKRPRTPVGLLQELGRQQKRVQTSSMLG